MKTSQLSIYLLSLFLTQFSFAGDLYLVCESENDFIDSAIVDGQTTMMVPIYDQDTALIKLKQLPRLDKSVFELNITILRQGREERFELTFFEELKIADYSCLIRD